MICKPCAIDADAQGSGAQPLPLGVSESEGYGHSICAGCDCQHKPVKEGQINGQAQ